MYKNYALMKLKSSTFHNMIYSIFIFYFHMLSNFNIFFNEKNNTIDTCEKIIISLNIYKKKNYYECFL